MIDYFALLDQQRRPWIEPESLKARFHELSKKLHPDHLQNVSPTGKLAAQERLSELNAAYKALKEPKDRIVHLLELERGNRGSQIQSVPAELMEVFNEMSMACRNADSLLAERESITSPLLRVNVFERGQEETAKLMALQRKINLRQEELLAQLRLIDAEWLSVDTPKGDRTVSHLNSLEQIGRLLGFFGRWGGQLQERILQLSL